MKKILQIITLLLSMSTFACECECNGDCSFKVISNNQEFVALVKVISFDTYLEREIMGHEGKMPYSMTVEIVKIYKGKEEHKTMRIWGDNGAACRPYLSNFEIGKSYLISPQKIEIAMSKMENINDYTFFICWTDYLQVDLNNNIAFGNYTKKVNKVSLKQFEKDLIK